MVLQNAKKLAELHAQTVKGECAVLPKSLNALRSRSAGRAQD
jgi:hypothetical protein